MSVAVDLFLEWAQCSSINSTQLNPPLRPASIQQWWLTAECSDGAAFFMNKLPRHWLLHQLLHLPRTNTVYSAWSMTHICAGVWGCGRPRAAPAKSQAEQKTERRFISTLLQLNNLSERHLGRVTMQVNPFPDCLPILLSLSGFNFSSFFPLFSCWFHMIDSADICQLWAH